MTDDLLALGRTLRDREPTAGELAARRAGRALYALAERLVVNAAPAATLEQLADALESLHAYLPIPAGDSRYDPLPVGATVIHALETHAIGGPANPIAMPLEMMVGDDGGFVGHTTFGPLHEGTPGVVHGGFVAAVFDQLLGAAAASSGQAMVTGTMTIRYLRPTPIGVALAFSTRLESTHGRRLMVAGECAAGGLITAEAEAVFVTVDGERYRRR